MSAQIQQAEMHGRDGPISPAGVHTNLGLHTSGLQRLGLLMEEASLDTKQRNGRNHASAASTNVHRTSPHLAWW